MGSYNLDSGIWLLLIDVVSELHPRLSVSQYPGLFRSYIPVVFYCMNIPLFISPTLGGHFGCFQCLAVMKDSVTVLFAPLVDTFIHFSWTYYYLEVEQLQYRVGIGIFSALWGTPNSYPKWLYQFYPH